MLRLVICLILHQVDILKRLTSLVQAITLIDYGNFITTSDHYHHSYLSCHDLVESARKFYHAHIYLHLGLGW